LDAAPSLNFIECEQAVNADPAAQLRLLDLQAADTAGAQLVHRRQALPEIAAIAGIDERSGRLRDEIVELQTQLADVDGSQRQFENEIDVVRTRAERDQSRLLAGGLPAKELEGLQHEITSLARRQSSLEDDLLEVMEQRESVDTQLSTLTAQLQTADSERAELVTARDAAFAEIDAATTEKQALRRAIATELPADLITLYDKIRASNGGTGAAALKQRRCEGCRIELAGNELSDVRKAAPETVVRCENCRRILVRTAESGL
jgi:predicted  nucleic acid-binding Zn-ribbon protein